MKKILIIGAHGFGKAAFCELLVQKLKEQHGNDIIIFTPEEAEKHNLKPEYFDNIPTMKIEKRPEIFIPEYTHVDLQNSHPFQKFIGKPKYKGRR